MICKLIDIIQLTQVTKGHSLISWATPQSPWNHPCSLWAVQRLCGAFSTVLVCESIRSNTPQVSGSPYRCCKFLRNACSLTGAVRINQLTDVKAFIKHLWERTVFPAPGQVTLNHRLLITCHAAKKAVVFVPDAVIQEKRCLSPVEKCILYLPTWSGSSPNT